MRRPALPWRIVAAFLAGALAVALTGCGTLLHPERQGTRGGRVDPAILVLDGALLFVFIVPGVVAYAIDFYTGAIYLPSGGRVSVIDVEPRDLDAARIESLVRAHTGTRLSLDDPRLVRLRVDSEEQAIEALRAFLPVAAS